MSTPLHFASGYNRIPVVEFLLINGANVHAKDKGYDDVLCRCVRVHDKRAGELVAVRVVCGGGGGGGVCVCGDYSLSAAVHAYQTVLQYMRIRLCSILGSVNAYQDCAVFLGRVVVWGTLFSSLPSLYYLL